VNTLEGRLRTAMRAAGETVAPNSAPPLRLPPPRRWPVAPRLGRPVWHGWLAPIAAAALVACALALPQVASMVVTGGAGKGNSAAPAGGIPPYYVVLSDENPVGPLGAAMIRETATGKLLTVVKPPGHGRFTAVTAAADQHTFVLAARVATPPSPHANVLRFFRLNVSQKTPVSRLTVLPLTVSPNTTFLTGLALSPDGTRLALSLTAGYTSQIRVVSMVTGRSRTWSGVSPGRPRNPRVPGPGWIDGLSWAADDRTLAYNDLSNIRVLDTAAPGASLKLDSVNRVTGGETGGVRIARVCAPFSKDPFSGFNGNALLSADGHLVIAGVYRHGTTAIATIPPALWQSGTLSYPCLAAAWRMVSSRLQQFRYGNRTGNAEWIYWVSPTGDSMIVAANFGPGPGLVGVVRDNNFTPLPGTAQIPTSPAQNVPAAW
jgi:hypothetical protein